MSGMNPKRLIWAQFIQSLNRQTWHIQGDDKSLYEYDHVVLDTVGISLLISSRARTYLITNGRVILTWWEQCCSLFSWLSGFWDKDGQYKEIQIQMIYVVGWMQTRLWCSRFLRLTYLICTECQTYLWQTIKISLMLPCHVPHILKPFWQSNSFLKSRPFNRM